MDTKQKISLFKKRLEWHASNGFFNTKFRPIANYDSNLIKDVQYIEFMRKIGPIEVSSNDYQVMCVTEPATYKSHFDWWQDKTEDRGMQIFDIRNSNGAKTKDVQLIAYDSNLYFWGFDISVDPPKVIGENFGSVFDTSEFILLLDAILKEHENHQEIKIPDKFNLR